ncbi:MAG: TRAP transporter small permease [Gammaproteobacteria bacterium]|nr:TRAP transporter small permease [Gammaproteobacteria bacterium]
MESGPPPEAPSRAERFGRLLENVLLGIALFAMIALAAAQVLLRGSLGSSLAWADEALRLLVLWSAMLGAIAATRDNVHLRIDLLSRFLPAVWRRATAVLVDVFAAGVSALLAWYSWRFVAESREFGDQVLGDWPAWPFQAVLPAAFALIAYRYLLGLPRHFRRRNVATSPETS